MVLKWLLLVAVIATLGLMAYVRLAPVDPQRFHRDPVEARDPGTRGARLVPPEAPVFGMAPEELMRRLDAAILATPRTERVAGSVGEGHATYLTRSLVWGFPDFVTVRVLPEGEGATLAALGVSVYGGYDWKTNAKRLAGWLAAVEQGS